MARSKAYTEACVIYFWYFFKNLYKIISYFLVTKGFLFF